ncbi:hypothetical protein AB0M36_35045 [Actinoplanes sp. NPDC051346]|uniref:hypothetical protein n=1 Tax=Actinoplanes sp. NPDC051346 TaxID=3155048 RepID=UPI00342B9787
MRTTVTSTPKRRRPLATGPGSARNAALEKLVSGKTRFRVPALPAALQLDQADWSPLWDAILEQAEALEAGDADWW